MNEEKLSSDKVPQKFADWLLSMGCPSEKVPSVEKLAEMCRGQYYMVWRSLMEHVEPQTIIKNKRLQVFNNDIQRCQKMNAFTKPDSSVVVPEELSLWKQQKELKERLSEAEAKVMQAKLECNQLVEKVSNKLSHRNLVRVRVENAQRRAYLLQQVADELRNKKANLLETRSIADSLCCVDENVDVKSKLDKCTSRRQLVRAQSASVSNPLQSSITSNNGELNDSDEYLSLVRCSGEVLWPQLCERRSALNAALNVNTPSDDNIDKNRVSPKWVLSHTASIHCTLALDALKNKAHIQQTRTRLANALAQQNEQLSSESCELIVVRSEHARAESRLLILRAILDDVTHRRGTFHTDWDHNGTNNSGKQISVIDKAIESKRDEIKRLITSLSITERKIQNVRECLINVFNSFHTDSNTDHGRFGGNLSMPQELMASLQRFYEEKRDKRRNKADLSLDFDSPTSFSNSDLGDIQNPNYIDELRVYLKKFNLENNRKLVLDSGEKIWIFETLQSSIERFHSNMQEFEVSCAIMCPSMSLRSNLQRVKDIVNRREELRNTLKILEGRQKKCVDIDITSQKTEEEKAVDRIKKSLNEYLLSLQKTIKTLELGKENLKFWSDNQMRKYISNSRNIDGRTYKDYESYYVENINF